MAFLYDRPCVIIGGPARSGTTLLCEMVGAHRDAAILLEERFTDVVRAAERLASIRSRPEEAERHRIFGGSTSLLRARSANDDGALSQLSQVSGYRRRFEAIFRQVFALTCSRDEPSLVGSKLPIGRQWEELDYLSSRISDLRVLLIVRNPLDVISSSLVRARQARLGLDRWPFATVEAAFEEWMGSMRQMAALLSAASLPVMTVKYEALCASQAAERRRLFAFLGLSAPADEVDPGEAVAGIAAARAATAAPRQGLTDEDAGFLARELGPVDDIWPLLSPEEALKTFAATAKYVQSGGYAEFGTGAAASMLDGGFSFPESWGRWTDGPVACIRLRHDVRADDAVIDLDVALTLPGGARLEIKANDAPQVRAVAMVGQPVRVDIPARAMRRDGLLTVEIRILDPKAPDAPPLDDPRRLGVGLRGLRFGFTGG